LIIFLYPLDKYY